MLHIGDELARRLGSDADLSRRALEAFGLEEYRAGRLSRGELRDLLGFATRAELDGFLKIRVPEGGQTAAEVRQDLEDMARLSR